MMKILLNVWRLNWPRVPYHSSIRYPFARLIRSSCIRGSNHSGDVCRAAVSSGKHVCRGWRIYTTPVSVWIWPQHATYRNMYKACYVQKHFCAGFYVIFDGYSDGPSTNVWNMSDGQRNCNLLIYISRKICP